MRRHFVGYAVLALGLTVAPMATAAPASTFVMISADAIVYPPNATAEDFANPYPTTVTKTLQAAFQADNKNANPKLRGMEAFAFAINADGKIAYYHAINLAKADPAVRAYCEKVITHTQFAPPPKGFFMTRLAYCQSGRLANVDDHGDEIAPKPAARADAPGLYAEGVEFALSQVWSYPPEALANHIEGVVHRIMTVKNGLIVGVAKSGPDADPLLEHAFDKMWSDHPLIPDGYFVKPIGSEIVGGADSLNFTVPIAVEWKLNDSDAAPASSAAPTTPTTPAPLGKRTIVGKWAPDPNQCTPVDGMIGIGPLDMGGDEFACRFKSVSRTGDVVTWRGTCGFPTPPEPVTVVATLTGETLHISVNGNDNGAYRRCK
jgi:hypothetical protein